MSFNELEAPMCLRCSGFYSAFLVALLVLLIGRYRCRPLPLTVCCGVGILLVSVMGMDALVWPTSNWQRHITGVSAGAGFGLTAASLLIYKLKLPTGPAPSLRTWIYWGVAEGALAVAYLAPSSLTIMVMGIAALTGLVALVSVLDLLVIGAWVERGWWRASLLFALLVGEFIFMARIRG